MDIIHKNYRFTAVIEHDEDGFHGFCPDLRGCHTQGDTYEETVANIKDVIKLFVEDMLECGEEIPQSDDLKVLQVEVAI